MTPARKKRFLLIILMIAGVGVGVSFALKAFNENIMFFFSPDEVVAGKAPINKKFRIGGLVVVGSVNRPGDGLTVHFDLTNKGESITVNYTGILPDLFREGQGIIANGKLNTDGVFVAEEVLAKHDENYMAPEIAEAMKDKNMHNKSKDI
ncbi:MAG: cytochrome c maturation protein CcmE [Gammaproteobacteria bacterium]|nr:cytochrome c maturation protein CcmE [Gammaproteobacteria bacterium]